MKASARAGWGFHGAGRRAGGRGRATAVGAALTSLAVLCSGCGDGARDRDPEPGPAWQVVHEGLDAALLSVWASSATDVWAVGGDMRDGTGPLVIHYDGSGWRRLETGQSQGTLWWVFGFDGGPIFMGGAGGMILRYESEQFTAMNTPGGETVFGLWGASPDDVWAVGGASESGGGFAWRLHGDTWQHEPTLPSTVTSSAALWKVYGASPDDSWLVGSNGVSLHWDGARLSASDTGVGSSLFTVHGNSSRYAAVGGLASGVIVEHEGDWTDATPDPAPPALSGVCLDEEGGGFAVGAYGYIYRRGATGWQEEDTGFALSVNLHAVFRDSEGGVWAVGGQTSIEPVTDGVLVHLGEQRLPTGGI